MKQVGQCRKCIHVGWQACTTDYASSAAVSKASFASGLFTEGPMKADEGPKELPSWVPRSEFSRLRFKMLSEFTNLDSWNRCPAACKPASVSPAAA